MHPFWIIRQDAIATHTIGRRRITPVVQSIGLRWPRGGWLWQFPRRVEVEEVEDAEGRADSEAREVTRVPIPDITRYTLWFLYALTLALIIATILRSLRARRASTRAVAHRQAQ